MRRRTHCVRTSTSFPVAFFIAATVLVLLVHTSLTGTTATTRPTASTPVSRTTTTAKTTKKKTLYYRVKSGDTLESIATAHHTTVDHLLQLNPNVDPLALRTGERVRIR